MDNQITVQRHTIRILKNRAQRQLKNCSYKIKVQVNLPFIHFDLNPFSHLEDNRSNNLQRASQF